MKSSQFKKQLKYVFLFTGGLLLCYVLARAYLLSFTHDESLSYTIVEGNMTWLNTANNHLLNTSLMGLFDAIFGQSELSLRLPNVLSFILYLTGCFFILKRYRNIWVSIFGLILLCNPFLIEFFSLARGYGLSMGCLMISLYFLTRKKEKNSSSDRFLNDFFCTMVFAALGIYANLTLINYYICVIIIFVYRYLWVIKTYRKKPFNHVLFWGIILMSLIPLSLGVRRLLMLNEYGQIYYGSTRLLKSLQSLVESSVFKAEFVYISFLIVLITVLASLLLGIGYVIYKKRFNASLFHIILLIVFISAGMIAEHILFDANYPKSRTALFYIPILSIYFYELVSKLMAHFAFRKTLYIPLISILSLFLLSNFIAKANLSQTTSWKYDAQTKTAVYRIREETQDRATQYTISNHWLFSPTINFYIDLWDLNLLPSDRSGVSQNTDFIYRLNDTTEVEGFTELDHFKNVNSQLLMNDDLILN